MKLLRSRQLATHLKLSSLLQIEIFVDLLFKNIRLMLNGKLYDEQMQKVPAKAALRIIQKYTTQKF